MKIRKKIYLPGKSSIFFARVMQVGYGSKQHRPSSASEPGMGRVVRCWRQVILSA